MRISRRAILSIAGAIGLGSRSAAADEGADTPASEEGFGVGFGESFGGTPRSECFIVTASTHPNSPQVEHLRNFRDDVLKRNRLGRALVRLYYKTSPPIADWIERREWRRQLVRAAIVRPAVRLTDPLINHD